MWSLQASGVLAWNRPLPGGGHQGGPQCRPPPSSLYGERGPWGRLKGLAGATTCLPCQGPRLPCQPSWGRPLETYPPAGLEELDEDSMQTTKGLPLEGEPFQYHLLRKQLVLGR